MAGGDITDGGSEHLVNRVEVLDIEKPPRTEHIESRIDPRCDLTALNADDAEFLASFSEEDRKRVVRKVRQET